MVSARWRTFRDSLVKDYPQLQPDNPTYRWLVLVGVMITTFMAVLDVTIVNVALPKLMSSFGVPVDKVEWVLTAYLLVFGVMLPTSGWLADHLGYKLVFLLGVLLFTVGSFLCSLAWDFNMLIAFRVLQGAGSGILMPVGMAILTREFPPEQRGIALAFWTVAASASVSLGPAAGGYLIDNYSWHAIFDVNVPVGIFGMAALMIILRERKAATTRSFDVIGFLSLTIFLTFLLLALSNGNSAWNTGGWTSNYILTCLALSVIGLVVFLITEFTVEHPLIELNLLEQFQFCGQQYSAIHFRFRNVRQRLPAADLFAKLSRLYPFAGGNGVPSGGDSSGNQRPSGRNILRSVLSQITGLFGFGVNGLYFLPVQHPLALFGELRNNDSSLLARDRDGHPFRPPDDYGYIRHQPRQNGTGLRFIQCHQANRRKFRRGGVRLPFDSAGHLSLHHVWSTDQRQFGEPQRDHDETSILRRPQSGNDRRRCHEQSQGPNRLFCCQSGLYNGRR